MNEYREEGRPKAHREIGVLALHGLTGTPQVLGRSTAALEEAGYTVHAPLLPGHGTTVEDLARTSWDDWTKAADSSLSSLLDRTERVLVMGLSMGGTLALQLAGRRSQVAGVVAINSPAIPIPEVEQQLLSAIDEGETMIPDFGLDLADPTASAPAYGECPLVSMLELCRGIWEVQADLPNVTCPALLAASQIDNVIPALESREHIADLISGPVERLDLARSRHLATIDFDKQNIADSVLKFLQVLE